MPAISTRSFSPPVRQAVDTALAAAQRRPDDAASVGRLGMVLHAHQQLGAARACYRRASLLDPGSFDWHYYLGVASDGRTSIQALRAALRLKDYLPAKLKLGEALLSVGDSAGAATVYRGLHHPAALFGFGRATHDPRYYEKALAAFPQYGAALFALAQHYQRAGRAADARRLMHEYSKFKTFAPPVDDSLMRAVDALNRSPDTLLRLAADLEAQGQLAAAVDLQHKALELDPNLAQAHINLVSLYGRLRDSTKAEHHYRQAIAADPNAYDAYYNFGVMCYEAGRRDEARAAFSRALAINPRHAGAHNNLGALLQEQGRLAEASQHFRKAIEIQPDLRLARFHLGRIYVNQGRVSQAIEQFKHAVAVDDEATPTYLYALGAAQARAGDKTAAVSSLSLAHRKALARGQAALASSIERDIESLQR